MKNLYKYLLLVGSLYEIKGSIIQKTKETNTKINDTQVSLEKFFKKTKHNKSITQKNEETNTKINDIKVPLEEFFNETKLSNCINYLSDFWKTLNKIELEKTKFATKINEIENLFEFNKIGIKLPYLIGSYKDFIKNHSEIDFGRKLSILEVKESSQPYGQDLINELEKLYTMIKNDGPRLFYCLLVTISSYDVYFGSENQDLQKIRQELAQEDILQILNKVDKMEPNLFMPFNHSRYHYFSPYIYSQNQKNGKLDLDDTNFAWLWFSSLNLESKFIEELKNTSFDFEFLNQFFCDLLLYFIKHMEYHRYKRVGDLSSLQNFIFNNFNSFIERDFKKIKEKDQARYRSIMNRAVDKQAEEVQKLTTSNRS